MDKRPLREDWMPRELAALSKRCDVLERRLATVLGSYLVAVTVSQADPTHLAVTATFADGGTSVQTIPLAWFAP